LFTENNFFKNQESRIKNQESRIKNQESRIKNQESRIKNHISIIFDSQIKSSFSDKFSGTSQEKVDTKNEPLSKKLK